MTPNWTKHWELCQVHQISSDNYSTMCQVQLNHWGCGEYECKQKCSELLYAVVMAMI